MLDGCCWWYPHRHYSGAIWFFFGGLAGTDGCGRLSGSRRLPAGRGSEGLVIGFGGIDIRGRLGTAIPAGNDSDGRFGFVAEIGCGDCTPPDPVKSALVLTNELVCGGSACKLDPGFGGKEGLVGLDIALKDGRLGIDGLRLCEVP